jgi:hypothetical protein
MLNLLTLIPTQPGPEIDAGTAGQTLLDAIKAGEVTLAIGAGIMLLVWILRVLVFPNVSPKVIPYIAVAIATLGTLAVTLVADPSQWLQAVIQGVLAGVAAAGTYGLLPTKVKTKMKEVVESRQ